MTKLELLRAIRAKFMEKLEAKTGWGRLDVAAAYDAAVREVLEESME